MCTVPCQSSLSEAPLHTLIIAVTTKGHVLTQTDLEEACDNIQCLYTTKTLYVDNRTKGNPCNLTKGSYEKKNRT